MPRLRQKREKVFYVADVIFVKIIFQQLTIGNSVIKTLNLSGYLAAQDTNIKQ